MAQPDTPSSAVETEAALFGAVDRAPLTPVRRVVAERMAASWGDIPQVTQFDEIDLEPLERLRQRLADEAGEAGVRLTWLPFILKACARTLVSHPALNAAFDAQAGALILKRYVNLGVAVDTPAGLMRPVIKSVADLGWLDIARRLAALSGAARDGRLPFSDMEGASFSVTSLGRIGGTGFTPLVFPPETAILGIARASRRIVPEAGGIASCLRLPLALTYDHRAVDGAGAGRFLTELAACLEQPEPLAA